MPKFSGLQKVVLFAMIAFAAFFAFRMMSSGSRKSVTKALKNEHQLGSACMRYASDHQGNFPPSLDSLFPDYLTDRSVLASPLMPSEPAGYIYTPGLKIPGPVNVILIEDKFAPLQHIGIVTYVDGSSRVLNPPAGASFQPAP